MKTEDIQTLLEYREKPSDKVYLAVLQKEGLEWHVFANYGRRGASMQLADKGRYLLYAEAYKAHQALVKSKLAKGYTIAGSSTWSASSISTPSVAESKSEIVLGLLNPITRKHAEELIENDDYIMQQKYDGVRKAIHKSHSEIYGINRKGLITGLPKIIENEIKNMLDTNFVLDGEMIGDYLFVFDILLWEGIDVKEKPYWQRLALLKEVMETGSAIVPYIHIVESFSDTGDKHTKFQELMKENAEGVVFKHRSAPYVPGRPASGGQYLKFKFWETASFLCGEQTRGKRSVGISLMNASGKWEDVGNVTIPPSHEVPTIGSVIEVRYLYAFKNGSVYQPIYCGERDDISPNECRMNQLKYKPE